jgi:hypothetical protein
MLESGSSVRDLDSVDGHGKPEPALGPHLARGQAHGGGAAPASADMTSHGGTILNSTFTAAIFWGKSWGGSSYVQDKITGLDAFYLGYGGTSYAATSSEYTGTNGSVGLQSTYGGHYIDLSTGPTHAPKTTDILAEVCKMIPAASLAADGYYPVYTDLPRGSATYCAWHSYGNCGSVPVQFGFFFSLDGDPGCDPLDTTTSHSQGLAALANVSGHELSETITDPRNGGWYDSSGGENGDKCAWSFGAPYTTFLDGTHWKIQGNWSNAAYDAGKGYKNLNGQPGCLSGT